MTNYYYYDDYDYSYYYSVLVLEVLKGSADM